MDAKVILKFFGDLLYYKELLNIRELEDIYDAKSISDLDEIISKVDRGEYLVNIKKGESYLYYNK